MANRTVNLISDVWVKATVDTESPFKLINDGNRANRLLWIADAVQPPSTKESLQRAVGLTVDESMSRFDEMEGEDLWLLGKTGQTCIMVGPV